jgi:DNA replication protein DnaC
MCWQSSSNMPDETCQKCGGAGWVVAEREGLSGAERCECYGKRRTAERQNRSGIPPQFARVNLESFQLPADNPVARTGLSTVYVEVRRYAKEYPLTEKPGLLLVGGTGTGKTHLAVAALKILMSRGFDCIFFDYQTLLERIQRSWNPTAGAADREAYRQALDTDILLLDDLGARRALDWVEDTVTSIITHRYNHQKPLIATTNLPDPALGDSLVTKGGADVTGTPRMMKSLAEVIGERSRSRLFEMCRVVRMPSVEDYRLKRR